jgi:hypothetical protein
LVFSFWAALVLLAINLSSRPLPLGERHAYSSEPVASLPMTALG